MRIRINKTARKKGFRKLELPKAPKPKLIKQPKMPKMPKTKSYGF